MQKSRLPLVLVLILALVAAGVTRRLASARREAGRLLGTGDASSGASQLSRMNSFALTLLLGGLRGPLVMLLWSSSETQKSEKNLEDFDTKVEWIRLLQPEFDSVHIFQIWNKAYNISVQMASKENKYLTIVDAIDYGYRVDRDRPDNVNILFALGSVFGDKLANSAEKQFYSERVRAESLPHQSRQKLQANDPGYRRLQLDPVLDKDGNVLPAYLKPTQVRLFDQSNGEVYDGSQLQYLPKFQPYPYGVSPWGFAYAYEKRAQLLQRLGRQKHAQLAESVVDGRPAVDLKKWGEAEWEYARRLEIEAAGRDVPAERLDLEPVTADLPPDFRFAPDQEKKVKEAVASMDLALRVWRGSDQEYIDHIRRYPMDAAKYDSHRAELRAQAELTRADRDYLQALIAPPAERAALLKSAREYYRRAIPQYAAYILRFYLPVEGLPEGTKPADIEALLSAGDKLTPEDVMPKLNALLKAAESRGMLRDEASENVRYIRRAEVRLKNLPA